MYTIQRVPPSQRNKDGFGPYSIRKKILVNLGYPSSIVIVNIIDKSEL